MNGVGAVLLLVLLATVIEFVIERVLGESLNGKQMRYVAAVVGLVLGVALGFGMKLAAITALGLTDQPIDPWADHLVSGLIIGCGSSAVHQLLGKYAPAK